MGKKLVFCSDGTGNTFDTDRTNVTRLIQSLALDKHSEQVAVYDQGIGSNASRIKEVESYRAALADKEALHILPPPLPSRWPKSSIDRLLALTKGEGLKQNVFEMYRKLAQLYAGPEDRVFLFGFSRGAFTVRALAGLLYRCHLPPLSHCDCETRFEQAWALFDLEPMQFGHDKELRARVLESRKDQRPCRIHFMGLWDTVKAYGGLQPVRLPHLRHNPIVDHLRHALALHEQRAWFKPTTWGLLDSDAGPGKAMSRLLEEDHPQFRKQDIAEVWFAGCHSDVGGGKDEQVTATIALRWMLGEAVNVTPALRLNNSGTRLLAEVDRPEPPTIHPSQRPWWRLIEQVPRTEIDNNRQWPGVKGARGSNGKRLLEDYRRGGQVTDAINPSPSFGQGIDLKPGGTLFVHVTASQTHWLSEDIKLCETRSHPPLVQGQPTAHLG